MKSHLVIWIAGLVLAVVLVIASAVAGASGSTADGSAHVFVVPAEGKAAAALARAHARVIARYGTFTLVEAGGDDARTLRAAGADRRDDMREVTIANRALDPAKQRSALATKTRGPHGAGFAVVQFVGPIKDGWLSRLRKTGARIIIYMPQNSYLVHGSAGELAKLAALAGTDQAVRAVVPYTAQDKLRTGVKSSGSQRLAVQSLSGDDGSAARNRVTRAANRRLRGTSSVGPFRTQYVSADAPALTALATDPGIVSIEPASRYEPQDERQAQILAGNVAGAEPLVPTGPDYFAFHESLGLGAATFPFAVGVTDTGLDRGSTSQVHPDFVERGVSRVTYADDFTSDPDATDCDGHGTINAGIIAGLNTDNGAAAEDVGGFNYDLGVAPRAKIGGSKIFNCAGEFDLTSSLTALTASAYAKGARISSNSWGCAECAGGYDADSQEYDKLVRDANPGVAGNQQMVELFSAGNEGPSTDSIGAPGNAKNVLTVGASENVRASGADGCGITNSGADDARDIINFSSRGPAPGGRIKPDLVGPGTHVTGSAPQHAGYTGAGVCTQFSPLGQTLYSLSSGTSHSTPAVAGMAALVREWYRQKKGGGTAVPSPALTKAILANGASDLVGGADGAGATNTNVPDQTQGWGLGNLRRSLSSAPRFFRDQQDVIGTTGNSFSYVLSVQDTGQPVRVTLAYTDAFGPTGANPAVNDLDLTVSGEAGTFKGNVFSGGRSVAGGTADSVNNLESVYIPAGVSGSFSVQVTAANIRRRRAGQRGPNRPGLRARRVKRGHDDRARAHSADLDRDAGR